MSAIKFNMSYPFFLIHHLIENSMVLLTVTQSVIVCRKILRWNFPGTRDPSDFGVARWEWRKRLNNSIKRDVIINR